MNRHLVLSFSRSAGRRTRNVGFALIAVLGLAATAAAQTTTTFPVPLPAQGPTDIVRGPDGNLWFTLRLSNSIGRITPTGTFTNFPTPTNPSRPRGITVGPDGALWFTEPLSLFADPGPFKVGRITTAGAITEITLDATVGQPTTIATGSDGNLWIGTQTGQVVRLTTAGVQTIFALTWAGRPAEITSGPDGNLWFTDAFGSSIGRVTTAGVITQFPMPTAGTQPGGIVSGPDGALWFTQLHNLGKITTSGVITEFVSPDGGTDITAGPDGALWYTISQGSGARLGRITTSGSVTFSTIDPGGAVGTDGIALGPDGNLWVTALSRNVVWRFNLSPGPAATGQTFAEFLICPPGSQPNGIAHGPDGNLWFTESSNGANRIGRSTPEGAITEFVIPTPNSRPVGIAAGPDGALWFTEHAAGQIGRITTAGVITEFPIPGGFSAPPRITAGPDGALWFTLPRGGPASIGRITTAGVITEFPISGGGSPGGITPGPDGNLWYTNAGGGSGSAIGRITPSGAITEFSLPDVTSSPTEIVTGPDGALWFTEEAGNRVGRITTAGVITEFTIPSPTSGPVGIARGLDGNLWFTENVANRIGRITTSGVITEFPVPTFGSAPAGITAGPEGALWFTENAGGRVGRMTTSGPSSGNRLVSRVFPVLADISGNGRPGTGDLALLISMAGTNVSVVNPWEDCAGTLLNQFTVSNPHPVTGQYQTFTRIHGGQTEEITVGGLTGNGSPTSAAMQVTGPGVNRTGNGGLVDADGDGVYEGLQGTETGLGGLTFAMDFVYSDETGDGRPDYVSLPWAQTSVLGVQPIPGTSTNPQVWVPLADTDGNGTPDSVAFDLDGDGVADPLSFTSPPVSTGTAPLDFYTVTPCRVLDTRLADGPLGGPVLAANTERTFVVTGQCGIPLNASAISANLTVTQPTDQGNLRHFPSGTPLPLVSTINYRAGQTRANNAIVVLGPGGDFVVRCAQVSGTTHFILDVNGYFAAAGAGSIAPGTVAGGSVSGGSSWRSAPVLSGRLVLTSFWTLLLTIGLCSAFWLYLKRRGLEAGRSPVP